MSTLKKNEKAVSQKKRKMVRKRNGNVTALSNTQRPKKRFKPMIPKKNKKCKKVQPKLTPLQIYRQLKDKKAAAYEAEKLKAALERAKEQELQKAAEEQTEGQTEEPEQEEEEEEEVLEEHSTTSESKRRKGKKKQKQKTSADPNKPKARINKRKTKKSPSTSSKDKQTSKKKAKKSTKSEMAKIEEQKEKDEESSEDESMDIAYPIISHSIQKKPPNLPLIDVRPLPPKKSAVGVSPKPFSSADSFSSDDSLSDDSSSDDYSSDEDMVAVESELQKNVDASKAQVRLNSQGEVVIDQNSVKGCHYLHLTAGSVDGRRNAFGKEISEKWSPAELSLFYRFLEQYGTDFDLIETFFPRRSRRNLYNKFKKEEKLNPHKVDAALQHKGRFSAIGFPELKQLRKDRQIGRKVTFGCRGVL